MIRHLLYFCLCLAGALLLTALAPLEKTLGANARLVYLHGAWVWTAMVSFVIAGLAGLIALLTRQPGWDAWAMAWQRTALSFWLTFLPMSLYVMQANWNGIYVSEPRFRIPLNLAIIGVLINVGLTLLQKPRWSSALILLFSAYLVGTMQQAESILHPDSPIFNSNDRSIQAFFVGLLILLLLAAWQMAHIWNRKALSRPSVVPRTSGVDVTGEQSSPE